ncbi:hypothetical protein RFI_02616 [Reticulomyxa filosa]|uniref:Uncharacterized protein n=1 Tax=Reticulomyxa filosa TaxID=46433 RepID=X6P8U7_RETFI|nr:hypothetical protein RFI_02616 [Reticulomyxa filosa]|eukprot:ETO34479.1 hypothetical protein RFI_02616 [Reticulomyxa filosa]
MCINRLVELGFFEETILQLLFPQKILDQILTNIDLTNSFALVRAFGKCGHMNTELLGLLSKFIIHDRSRFSFAQLIECTWALLWLDTLPTKDNYKINPNAVGNGIVEDKEFQALLKTLSGMLLNYDCNTLEDETITQLLQLKTLVTLRDNNRGTFEPFLIPFENNLKLILQDSLNSRDNDEFCTSGRESPTFRSKKDYIALITKCMEQLMLTKSPITNQATKHINQKLKRKDLYVKVEKDGQIVPAIVNQLVTPNWIVSNSLVVDLCLDSKLKLGIQIVGPSDCFIDNINELTGVTRCNTYLLQQLFGWNLRL